MNLKCVDCGHQFIDELDLRYHDISHDYEGFTTMEIDN